MSVTLRRATVNGNPDTIAAYLPANYRIESANGDCVTIAGYDSAGWTLDDYVIPRLASGLLFAKEIR